jgi:hypothetical protein
MDQSLDRGRKEEKEEVKERTREVYKHQITYESHTRGDFSLIGSFVLSFIPLIR